MIKSVIFDLDGTLIDSIHTIRDSMNLLLKEIDLPEYTYEDYCSFVGDGIDMLIKRALPEHYHDKDNLDDFTERYREIYSRTWRERTKPFNGIIDALKQIVSSGIKIFVFSNKTESYTKLQVKELFPDIEFEEVIGATPRRPLKPDPSGALELLSKNGIRPENTIFAGDSGIDMETAKRGNMIPVGVSWGFRDREELLKYGAKFIIDHPSEFKDIVLNNASENSRN